MRKILFRGFHPDVDGTTTITLNGIKIRGEWLISPSIFQCKNGLLTQLAIGESQNIYEDVLSETVGQWVTTDKNGDDIFEGDIVLFEDESPGNYEYHDSTEMREGEVWYDNGEYYVTNKIALEMDDFRCDDYWECEVIGNKWEDK